MDMERTDEYPNLIVPDADFETCLKVLRTVRNACLLPNVFDAEGAVLLSHAHAKLVELARCCDEPGQRPEGFPECRGLPPAPGDMWTAVRCVEYRGDRKWLERTLKHSISGTWQIGNGSALDNMIIGRLLQGPQPEARQVSVPTDEPLIREGSHASPTIEG